jgi:hypothetical protein
MVARIGAMARQVLPPEATVLVVSRGDANLLDVGRHASHFPQTPDGQWTGHHPATSDDAIAHLEELRAGGASHLLLPATAMWWLNHYAGLADHLAHHATVLAETDDCALFSLTAPTPSRSTVELTSLVR